MIKFATYIYII